MYITLAYFLKLTYKADFARATNLRTLLNKFQQLCVDEQ